MEKALHQYTLEPSEKPFDMKSIPLAMAPAFEQKAGNGNTSLLVFLCLSSVISIFSLVLPLFV